MRSEDVDWNRGGGSGRGRIEVLAELRNVALEPLVKESGKRSWVSSRRPEGCFSAFRSLKAALATSAYLISSSILVSLSQGPIVFFNDVLFSAPHVLELLHRHVQNEATQTCAWDVLYNP